MAGVTSQEDILSLIQSHQVDIRAFGVRKLGLFGSFVRGQQDESSDVDLLVEFEMGCKTFDAFIQLAFFLEELLGRHVELVTIESLSPHLGPHILKEVKYVAFGA